MHCIQLMPHCDMRSVLRYGLPARAIGSGRVCVESFSTSEAKTSKQSSHVLETQNDWALQVEKGKDATEACDGRGKDQQVSGEERRAKNHKVPVAYAAGLMGLLSCHV
jgi:hypothetical protein